MKAQPLVSVLMPVYNGGKYLGEAIKSILNQTYTNLELIICNDASTDDSKEVIQGFDDVRICYVENETNRGIVGTRNRLFSLAKGKYFSIMDCDDVALPEKIELQIDFMERHPEYGICGTWARKVNDKNETTGYIQMPPKDVYIRINLLFQSSFVQSSVIISREALGALSYDPGFPVAEDYDLWERISHRTRMYNLPEFLLLYRWHGENISQQADRLMEKKRTEIIDRQLKERFASLYDKYGDKIEEHKLIGTLTYGGTESFSSALKKSGKWYSVLIRQNKKEGCFPITAFNSFIWYRWFFYCFYHKKYFRACFPPFFTLNPVIIGKLMCLVSYKLKSVFPK